jgi:type II secretory pathway component PulF
MEEELLKKLEEQGKKIEEIYRSVEKMRKFFLWTLIITAVVIILPLIGLIFVIPQFLNLYTGMGL